MKGNPGRCTNGTERLSPLAKGTSSKSPLNEVVQGNEQPDSPFSQPTQPAQPALGRRSRFSQLLTREGLEGCADARVVTSAEDQIVFGTETSARCSRSENDLHSQRNQNAGERSPWLTVDEAADRARCGPKLIYREVRARRLAAARVGGRRELRLRAEWVDDWLMRATSPIVEPPLR